MPKRVNTTDLKDASKTIIIQTKNHKYKENDDKVKKTENDAIIRQCTTIYPHICVITHKIKRNKKELIK